jgi:parallel beta-helix repeat protein
MISSANATKITVGYMDAEYRHIQNAIDNARIGDVIEVYSGVYTERVLVNKILTIQGIDTGDGLPVINASGFGSAITLSANGSVVKGLNLTGSGGCSCGNAGILIQSSNNIIQDNIIYRNKYGIYIKPGSTNNTFVLNRLIENEVASNAAEGLQGFIKLPARN